MARWVGATGPARSLADRTPSPSELALQKLCLYDADPSEPDENEADASFPNTHPPVDGCLPRTACPKAAAEVQHCQRVFSVLAFELELSPAWLTSE